MTGQSNRYERSAAAHAVARALMPGGVNSPARAYQAVGCDPITIRSGRDCHVTDIDGNTYIDYVASYGPLILGHAHPAVVEAVQQAAADGLTFGMPTELENQLAEMVIECVPSVEIVRFVNSGTEATMSTLRLARGATGRSKVIKCIGGYHGHIDALLVQAGSGATTLGTPSSPGVPEAMTADTLLMEYNDPEAAAALFAEHGERIAAVMIEPVAGNMGCIPPDPGYLQALRDLCDRHGALLIFDEVMTGFRVALGGAQERFAVTPDLTAMGKVIGGGMPCAAYGGREDLMRQIAPDGPIYQAGTLSGNPLAMAAGLATLRELRKPGQYDRLETLGSRLADGLRDAAQQAGVPMVVHQVGAMVTPFFTDADAVRDYRDATGCDTQRFAAFFRAMLDANVVLPPSQYEAWFPGLAHDQATLAATDEAARAALATL